MNPSMITGSEIQLNLVQKPFFFPVKQNLVFKVLLFSVFEVCLFLQLASELKWPHVDLEDLLKNCYVWPIDAKTRASTSHTTDASMVFLWEKWYSIDPYQTHKQTPYPTCVFGPYPTTTRKRKKPTTTATFLCEKNNPKKALPENVLHKRWKVSNSIHHW